MDLIELESKFRALEKLYGLLLKNYEDTSHSSVDKLDDGARYMLKKLLDVEAEKVNRAHSEILQSKGVDESCSSQQLIDDNMNEKSHAGEVPVQASVCDREDLTTDLMIPLREEKNLCDPASPEEKVNRLDVICNASEFDHVKKICRICNRRQSKPSSILSDRGRSETSKAVNDLHPAGFIIENDEHNKRGSDSDTNVSLVELSGNSKENLSSKGGPRDSSSAAISASLTSHSAAETNVNKKGTNSLYKADADFVSVEASAAVVKNQSHITDLNLDAQSLLPPRKRAARAMMALPTDSGSPSMLMKGGKAVADTASSQTRMGQVESEQRIGEVSIQTNRKQTRQNVVPSPAMRTPLNRFESLCNRLVPVDRLQSQDRRHRGFEFQEHEANKSKWRKIPTARYISQMNKEHRDKQVCSSNEGTRKKLVDRTPHIIRPIARIPSRRQHFPIKSPSLSMEEHEPSQPSVSSLHDSLLDQHKKIRRRMGKTHMDPGETESTDSDYSEGTNQKSSDSVNEIDLNSGSAEIFTSETPSSRSDSDDVDSLPRRTGHLLASSTGSSETEAYSSASRRDTEIYSSTSRNGSHQEATTSSNERHDYTSDVRPGTKTNHEQSYSSDDNEPSRKSGGVHTNTSLNSQNRKRSGGLKKMKDKLAIIFHHHHHHHHHVHRSDKDDQKKPVRAKNRSKSLWKRSKKVTDLEREKEIKGEHAVEKSLVRGGTRKSQHGHFHELVKGFLRHKKQSRPSKSSKLAGKQSRINRDSKKAPKKSHWYKMLKNQKRSKAHKKHIL